MIALTSGASVIGAADTVSQNVVFALVIFVLPHLTGIVAFLGCN